VACSDNFVVRCHGTDLTAAEVRNSCERLRIQLQTTWLGAASTNPWSPRCEVVLHGSRSAYQQAVGRGASQTTGSSLIRFANRRVVVRRIDLAPAAGGSASALAHEMTHVVLADRFQGRQPPRGADGGIATLSDHAEMQALHERDLRRARSSGTSFPLPDLLGLEQCSTYDQFATFYGQSLSLVEFLVRQDSPEQFVAFLELAMMQGYDQALRQTYRMENVAHLERRWRQHALAEANAPTVARSVSLSSPPSP
jgi:hypothetical protein